MKFLPILMLLALLASCGANDVQEAPIANVKEVIEAPIKTEQPPVTPEDTIEVEQKKNEEPPVEVAEEEEAVSPEPEETTQDLEETINEAAESIWNETNNELKTVNADYTNPNGAVDMVISYSLDSEWKIQEISTAATTYDLSQFNDAVQEVNGKTVEEASEMYFSGSSLTTWAFQKAMKAEIK